MKNDSCRPFTQRIPLVVAIVLSMLVLLSCMGRSTPGTQPPDTLAGEAAEVQDPTDEPEPDEELEPTEEPEIRPDGVDLGVYVSHEEGIRRGAVVLYSIYYDNTDWEREAPETVLSVTIPKGAEVLSSSRQDEPFPPSKTSGQVLEYQLGTLAPYDADAILIELQMPEDLTLASEVGVSVRIASAEPDPDPESNYSEDMEAVDAAQPYVWLGLAEECGPFVAGAPVTYAIEYGNNSWQVPAESTVITNALPAGVTFHSARLLIDEESRPLSPKVNGGLLSFDLATLEPEGYGYILVDAVLAGDLYPQDVLTATAGIATTSDELYPEDNWSEYIETVVPDEADVWVALESFSDYELGGGQYYSLSYGNEGPKDASKVGLSLTIPAQLRNVTFEPQPTTYKGGTATWQIDLLEAWTYGDVIEVCAEIGEAGTAAAKAAITTASTDADPRNNNAELSDELVSILAPEIAGPNDAIVNDRPVFYGWGKPEATVSLYISATENAAGGLLGTATIDDGGYWELVPPTPFEQPGWYWITATQKLGSLVSAVTGVGNYYREGLDIDPSSLTVSGERVGGIDQAISWHAGDEYEVAARITSCADPLTPTLQVRYYNDKGLMTGHKKLRPIEVGDDGLVTFLFATPEEGSEFQLELGFFCREQGQTASVGRSRGLAAPVRKGIRDLWHPECWFGGCGNDDPPPPPPPSQCPGCTPIQRPKKRPKPVDPDGFVYDAAKVEAGATMEQAIITRAWVTATQQIELGIFEPWNALEYSQVNPQFTDSEYPDKVLKPGYYSFLVPPGNYRIRVTAPGYLPFNSEILRVANNPITLHVPLKRAKGVSREVLGNP